MLHADVIIVGGGIMGCAVAHALVQRGARVLLLERGRIGGEQGSSHGRSRIIRLAYGAVDYIALCRAAYAAWHTLEETVGETLMRPTGGLDIALPGVASWERARAAMRAAEVPFEELDAAEAERRFPQFGLPAGTCALFQADAAVLHADRCLAALADAARRHGATLLEGRSVRSLTATPPNLALDVDGETVCADRLILAAGAHMPRLLRAVGLSLPLSSSVEQVAYFQARETAAFAPGRFPLFITHFSDGRLGSGFPLIREAGLKLMLESKLAADDCGDGAAPVDVARLEALRQHALQLLPGLTGEIIAATTCRYTLTPDEDFILDRHPHDPRIVVVSACSGHGFKFGALFGVAIADLALGRAPAIDLHRFRLDRFVRAASGVPAMA